MALVGGEEQKQEVGGTDEELWNLCSLITANQRRRWIASIPHLENVVVDLRPESVGQKRRHASALQLPNKPSTQIHLSLTQFCSSRISHIYSKHTTTTSFTLKTQLSKKHHVLFEFSQNSCCFFRQRTSAYSPASKLLLR